MSDRNSWAGFSREEAARREESSRKYVRAPWLAAWDREFYEEFGRWPSGATMHGSAPVNTARRQAVINLIERGATEGERDAARAALQRLDDAAELAELHRLRPDLLEQDDDELE